MSSTPDHAPDESPHRLGMCLGQPVLYPDIYVWFVFLAAVDLMLTWVILATGGKELNWIAASIVEHFNLPGLAGYKFGLVVFVIGMCEAVGRRRASAGYRLAEWAVALSAIPVVISMVLLAAWGLVRTSA
ncbi:MAG: hypothetical protein GY842_17695 [bacterium]|nr:hypothetical protein [bacterium]